MVSHICLGPEKKLKIFLVIAEGTGQTRLYQGNLLRGIVNCLGGGSIYIVSNRISLINVLP